MQNLYENCMICPRRCGADRSEGRVGFCRMTDQIYISRAALHFWEEPCISGLRGSGTVFFSGCNLHCIYCQNREISRGEAGARITPERLSDIFLSLQDQGAENINLVTPTHYIPTLLSVIPMARKSGLSIPVVYNTSGYESVESLRLLEGIVDVYLTDFKYRDPKASLAYSFASDYPDVAMRALREMVRQTGAPRYDERGMMQSGVIVRHLVLPGMEDDSIELLSDLYAMYGERIVLSVMRQYTPPSGCDLPTSLRQPVSDGAYEKVCSALRSLGVVNAYLQEGEAVSESFLPPFDLQGVLEE